MTWARALLTIFFGAVAGGVTNRVAIWMLFHPYEPPRLFGRTIAWMQGALPKNQARLAATVGRAVGTRLLTADDLAAELQDEELRETFATRIREILEDLIEEEHPALSEILPERVLEEAETLLGQVFDELVERAIAGLDSPGFAAEAEQLLEASADLLEGERLSETLDEERLRALRERAGEWLGELVDSPALETTVERQLERLGTELLRPGRTLEEMIPARLVSTVEHATQDYLPLVMEKLGRLLEDPKARERVEKVVRQLLDRFMSDLRFHQRVIAKLIITEETVLRVIDTIEADGADRLSELLRESEVQDAIARGVNETIVEFLRRPIVSVLGSPDEPQVESAREALAEWIVRTARDPSAREFLLDQAEETVERVGDRSWADALRTLPAARLGSWIASALGTEPGRQLIAAAREPTVRWALTRPIGRPGHLLGEDAAARLGGTLSPHIWSWITRQVPEIASRVRVAERVEEKIRDYPLAQLETLVRSVTEQELKLIVRLGYVLGGVIGTVLVGITILIG